MDYSGRLKWPCLFLVQEYLSELTEHLLKCFTELMALKLTSNNTNLIAQLVLREVILVSVFLHTVGLCPLCGTEIASFFLNVLFIIDTLSS